MQPTLLIAALAALAAAPAWGKDNPVKEFQRKYNEQPNSWERIDLIKGLDPGDKKQLDVLTNFVLARGEWFYREAAIDVLAGVHDEDVIKRLERMSKKEIVAEAVCLAFGQSGNKDRIEFLIKQLDNKKWKVKRAAAIALAKMPDKRGVEALISAWENEDMFMVWVHILESLERITREKNLDTAEKWRGWWDAVKATWEVPTGEVDEEALGGGEINKTKVRGTNLDFRSRGKGLPLLVLPDYGYEKDYLETYLRELEDSNRILYMALPGAADFTDPPLKPEVGGLPYYPIDRIVEAFEGLHEVLVKEKKIEDKPFALMAHGMTCWIAMKFAEKHPRLVRKMILISPVSGNKAWGDGRDRTETEGNKRGDIEMEHYAQSQLIDGQTGKPRYEAGDERESRALQRKGHTLMFADHRDLEIGRILGPIKEKIVDTPQGKARSVGFEAFRPMGGVLIPEFSLFKLNRTRTATLIFYGPHSLRTSADDCGAIQKHYGTAGVVTFKKSSRMPFIEENEDFVNKVRKFLGGKKPKKKKKKKKKR